MFAKDIDLLNNLYNEKILTEMNLGPRAEQNSDSAFSPNKKEAIQMPPVRPCSKCEDCGEEEEHEECESIANHEDTNAGMAKQSLFRLVKLSAMLHDLICKEQSVEPWVLTKVTEALNHVESVYGYMDYENYRHQVESDITEIEEETEVDLYNTIASGSTRLLSNIKRLLATESKENLEGLLYETITALELKK